LQQARRKAAQRGGKKNRAAVARQAHDARTSAIWRRRRIRILRDLRAPGRVRTATDGRAWRAPRYNALVFAR